MPDYYFDIETCSRTRDPDFRKDAIIAITYQQIDSSTGQPKDKLNILKAWESSEAKILQQFYPTFYPQEKWGFVPIGNNLSFDFTSLAFRLKTINIELRATSLFAERPYIDLQSILIMCNGGSFKGCTLDKFVGKQYPGSKVIEWYDQRNYSAIESYIKDEAECFLRFYQFLVRRLPEVWLEFAKQQKIII